MPSSQSPPKSRRTCSDKWFPQACRFAAEPLLTGGGEVFTLARTMLARSAHIAAVLLSIFAPLLAAEVPEPAIAPGAGDQGVLVLRNGQVLQGRITQSNGMYVVDLSDGRLRVRAAEVEMVCRDLEEGYRKKRATIQPGNVHHHLELAQWCLQHDLLRAAAAELADAAAIEPDHPMLGALQYRLKMALAPPAAPDAKSARRVAPSNDDLDRMVQSLPHGAVEDFTQAVQPVLMNNCATGGCHGPQSDTSFRLFRVATGKWASRRITQRNLYAVLPFIDRNNPADSRLLTAAAGPHGTVKHAIFDEHQAGQYQRLVGWACELAQQPHFEMPATLGGLAAELRGRPVVPSQMASHEAKKARRVTSLEQEKVVQRGAGSRRNSTGKVAPASFAQPADPYDPEPFNRRYAAEREQQRTKKEAAEAKQ